MADRVRITFAEALRVRDEIKRYHDTFPSARRDIPTGGAEESLVNAIGEIYETALARAIKESVGGVSEGR